MSNNKFISYPIIKKFVFSLFFTIGLTTFPQQAESVGITGSNDCPSPGHTSNMSADCYETPEKFVTYFFEVGVCSGNPFQVSGNNVSNFKFGGANTQRGVASCRRIWQSNKDNGTPIDLVQCMNKNCEFPDREVHSSRNWNNAYATGWSSVLTETGNFPEVITHAYVIMGINQTIKGKVHFKGKTYYTTRNNYLESTNGGGVTQYYSKPTDQESAYDEYKYTHLLIGNDGRDYKQSTDYGTVFATLTNNNYQDISTTTTPERLIGVLELTTPLTQKQFGSKLTWNLTKMGLWADHDAGNEPVEAGAPTGFGTGPFVLEFE